MVGENAEARNKSRSRASFVVYGLITFVVVAMSYAAYDDISTSDETDFALEWSVLAVCAVWCVLVAARLLAARYLVLGAATTLVLAAAVWEHRSIGPDTIPGWYPEYVSTVGALGWYLVLSGYLMVSGWRTLTMGGR